MFGRPVGRQRPRFYSQWHKAARECRPSHQRQRGTGSVTTSNPTPSKPGDAQRNALRDQRADVPIDMLPGTPLGIICGSGTVPYAVADAAMRRGRAIVLFPLRGWADAAAVKAYPHHWIVLGQFGRFRRLAGAERCRDLVLVGGLIRPSIMQLRLDWGTLMRMPMIIRSFRGGDDHLLSGVGRLFENAGFRVVGAHEVAPEITAPIGALGRLRPDVAVEDAEGTDAMLDRVAAMREAGRITLAAGTGVLVKAPKHRQDRRFDLPSIGPDTAARAARAGLAGIAVVARATIVAEPQRLVEVADRAGLFVVGHPDQEVAI